MGSLVTLHGLPRQIVFAKVVGTKEALHANAAQEHKVADASTFDADAFTVSDLLPNGPFC